MSVPSSLRGALREVWARAAGCGRGGPRPAVRPSAGGDRGDDGRTELNNARALGACDGCEAALIKAIDDGHCEIRHIIAEHRASAHVSFIQRALAQTREGAIDFS